MYRPCKQGQFLESILRSLFWASLTSGRWLVGWSAGPAKVLAVVAEGFGPKWQCRAALAISAYVMFPLREHCVGGEKARAFGLAQLLADRCRSRLVCMMGPLFSTEKMI